uniref:Uncharacterized protein n=1 Tax=Triticum urartu TaxID=4572 RepID=A0A8R7UZM9_TRIUA
MVDVVVRRVVPEAEAEHVPRQPQAAVVVHALDGTEREEEDGDTGRHTGGEEGERPADGVEEEALHGVVVLRAEGVGHDQAVVPRVDVPVQELVEVHASVPRVLPPVQHGHAHRDLHRYRQARCPGRPLRCFAGGRRGAFASKLCVRTYTICYECLQVLSCVQSSHIP